MGITVDEFIDALGRYPKRKKRGCIGNGTEPKQYPFRDKMLTVRQFANRIDRTCACVYGYMAKGLSFDDIWQKIMTPHPEYAVCSSCRKPNDDMRYKMCSRCREMSRMYGKKR